MCMIKNSYITKVCYICIGDKNIIYCKRMLYICIRNVLYDKRLLYEYKHSLYIYTWWKLLYIHTTIFHHIYIYIYIYIYITKDCHTYIYIYITKDCQPWLGKCYFSSPGYKFQVVIHKYKIPNFYNFFLFIYLFLIHFRVWRIERVRAEKYLSLTPNGGYILHLFLSLFVMA